MNRRDFLKRTGYATFTSATLFSALRSIYADHKINQISVCELPLFQIDKQAVEEGKRIGIGSAVLDGPEQAEVFTYQTFSVAYTTGKAGIKPGGGIRIGIRHLAPLWSIVQNDDPKSEGYLTVKTSADVQASVTVECRNWSEKFFNLYFPWQNIVEVIVGEPGLKPGDKLMVTYGDKTAGSPGFMTQPFKELPFIFKTYVDAPGKGQFLPLESNPQLNIIASKPEKLTVIAPSNAVIGKASWCVVRIEDRFGNPARRYRSKVQIKCGDAGAKLPTSYIFTAADKGVHRFENIFFNTPGCHSINVSNGSGQGQSNPVQVTDTEPEHLLLWGDIHGHTLNSDGRGTVKQYYDFAKTVAALDFCAVSEHAFEMLDDMWAESKAVTNKFNQPGRFVTFNAYEWSGFSEVGGDHNVYWLDDDPPLYRSSSYYNPNNLQMYHGPEPKVEHVTELYRILEERHLKNKNVFCIPHYGGRPANPLWHNRKVERLIEIFSEHRRSEDWATEFLQKEYHLGIIACGDNHYGSPGYGYLNRGQPNRADFKQEIGMGLVAVLATEHTRRSIFGALYDRHCYATSGDRIILDFRVDGHIMGSEYSTSQSPQIAVKVSGTDVITKIEIKKNCETVYTVKPDKRTFNLDWKDRNFDKKQRCLYYVRLLQANNEEAISSPVFVNSNTSVKG